MTAGVSSGHTAFEFPYVVSDNQLKTSAILNFILGAVSLLVFVVFRGTLRSVGGVYQRRRELADLFLQPPQLILGGLQQAWSWASTVMCMSDTDIVRTAGFDALLLNRTILMGLQIFSVLTLLALGILLPIYYSFDDVVTHRLHRGTNVAELSRTTISNLPPGHVILWLPTVATYLVIAHSCWVLLVHCQSYAELRMAYMLSLDAAGVQRYHQECEPHHTRKLHGGSGSWGGGRPWGGNSSVRFQDRDGSGRAGHRLAASIAGGAGAAASEPTSTPGSSASLHHLLSVEAAVTAQAQVPASVSLEGVSLPGHMSGDCSPYGRSHVIHTMMMDRQGLQGPMVRPLRSNLSSGSLQAAATAGLQVTVSVGPAAQRVGGLARVSFDPLDTLAAQKGSHAEAGQPAAPLTPQISGSMPLGMRLRLVAPWLRHVVVSSAERAARHKAADNLLAWVSPLKMLAKDREEWARQQLAADADPDPALPPVPSGHPPAVTAAHAGLLVASEEVLMALTGRAEDATEPDFTLEQAAGLRPPVEWSESVRELAKSLGILMRLGGSGSGDRCGGEKAATAHRRSGSTLAENAGGHKAAAARSELATHGLGSRGSCGGQEPGSASVAEEEGGAKRVVAVSYQASSGEGSRISAAAFRSRGGNKIGEMGHSAAAAAKVRKDVAPDGHCGVEADFSKSYQGPPVYRYWAPTAEQRCFCRNLRRRLQHQSPWQQAPGTPLGFDSVINPVFDLSAIPTAACSGGGSISGGGSGIATAAAAAGLGWQSGNAQFVQGMPSAAVSAKGSPGSGDEDGWGSGTAAPRRFASPSEEGVEWQRRALSGGGRDGNVWRTVACDEDEDGGHGDNRPWTGWQQQPLIVGRCNARLRQLMKVRHGGRSHLVNCHHYAVLVRDVVLRPVERFNVIGLPVVRSSVEDSHDPHPQDARDVELGERAGGNAAVSNGKALAFANTGRGPQTSGVELGNVAKGRMHASGDRFLDGSQSGGIEESCSNRGAGSGGNNYDGRGQQGKRRRDSKAERAGGAGAGAVLSDGGNRASSSDDGEKGDGEHKPLLMNDPDSNGDHDSSGAASPQRRRRPLLQPNSDLPMKDRAAHMILELRNHHKRDRHKYAVTAPSLDKEGGTVASTGANAAMSSIEGHELQITQSMQLSTACARGCSEGGGGGETRAGAGTESTQGGEKTPFLGKAYPPHSRCSSSSNGRTSLTAAIGAEGPVSNADNEPRRGFQGRWQGSRTGAEDQDPNSTPGPGAPTTSRLDAMPAGGSCSGAVPRPPPLMEVPYDVSEEAAAVAAYYTHLFPDSFQRLVPVCNHRAVDELLFQWTAAMRNLAGALLAAHIAIRSASTGSCASAAAAASSSPFSSPSAHAVISSGGTGSQSSAAAPTEPVAFGQPVLAPPDLPPVDSSHTTAIRRAAATVRQLQDRIAVERARTLRNPTRRAYFALFSSQRDAAAAAQCSPLAPPSRAQPLHFRACAAPPPDSVYWPALWTLPTGRAARLLASLPLLAVLIFPIGVLTGALANLPVAVCGGTPELNALYWPWFCNRQRSHSLYARVAKSLLTGLLPALLSLGWNAWVMPMVLYLLSAIQSRCVSLPAMDRQMSRWFFWWSLLNMFLGAVVGGSIFQQLGAYLQDPGKLLLRIGTALPTASNFFMHYTLTKGLYSNWLRVAWPHLGSMVGAILRSLTGAALPRSLQDVFLIHSPPGYRFSSFYNGVFQTLMVGLAYVVTAPLIAPIALLFFLTAYITWRYSIVYVYERQYESGGQMFPVVFSHMTGYLLMAELFTGAVLLTNGAWIQAALLWCSLTPAILAFHRLCERRYLWPLEHPPLSLAMASPPASVDSAVYLPPALREGSVGWYPESGKVWEQYGIPKYVI